MGAKQTVGIFSDYNATEKTFCALYLAEYLIEQRYRQVVWIVPNDVSLGNRYYGFPHKWDTQVLSLETQSAKIQEVLSDCKRCIFFDESAPLYDLLPAKTKTSLILDHRTWKGKPSRSFAARCTNTLSVSPYVTNKIVRTNLLDNTLSCPFDHSIQMIPKAAISSGQTATLFYPAYGMSFLERQCLSQIAEIVKACCLATKSVIGYYDARGIQLPGLDAKTYDWKLLDYLKQTNWIIDLNPRPLMGLFAAFAGALSIQWSCFDIPPNTDRYSAARRHTVPYPKGGLTAANVEKIAEHLVRHLNMTFNDDNERNKDAGSYIERLKGFSAVMNKFFKRKKKKKRKKSVRLHGV
jgi:hypothetical protein